LYTWFYRASQSISQIYFTNLVDEPHDWKDFLSKAAYVINNTFHQETKSKLLIGYDLKCRNDSLFAEFVKEFTQIDSDIENDK